MPAITADTITLPRIEAPLTAVVRPVRSITVGPTGFEGEGFPVRRAFAGVHTADLDPFIMMDQMGAVDYGPGEPKGTSWHPHRGFETATYLLDGAFEHQDSHGGGGLIQGGDTQWMTAGAGILHIERPPESLVISGGLFHGIQLWVNLPAARKFEPPRYQDIHGPSLSLASSSDGGALVRVIAGSFVDTEGNVIEGPGVTHTPIALVHITLSPGARLHLPWEPSYNALAYGLAGQGFVGAERAELGLGKLALHAGGDSILLEASPTRELDVLVLGGRPIREPVAHHGPFVMNTRAELIQAFEDFEAGRMGTIAR